MKPDEENPRPRPKYTTRRVFCCYLAQLLVRLMLGILFIVLQNFVFYPFGFPTEFTCVLPTVKPIENSTNTGHAVNSTEDDRSVNCDNSVGSENANWALGVSIVNILFASLVFGEMYYLLIRALISKEFAFDSEFCQKYLFNKGTPLKARTHVWNMRNFVDEGTEFIDPLYEPNEKNRTLDNMFVDLVIYTGRAIAEYTAFDLKLERHEVHEIYLKPQRGAVAINDLDELFLPNLDIEDPHKILIVGRPGIGKTLLCKKLWRGWSKGEMLRDSNKIFEHFFLFPFRWFNDIEEISLEQLLSVQCPEEHIDKDVFQHILDNPQKVILVFDGLDEFKDHKRCLEDEQPAKARKKKGEHSMPFFALYLKLVRGSKLRGATVVTTLRPTVLQSVANVKFDRTVEIMGFTQDKVQEYVHKFCGHEGELMNGIWEHISSNSELLSLCYIPVNSYIVCSYLEKLIKSPQSDEDDSTSRPILPTTTTKVFEGALRLFLFKHHPDFKNTKLTKEHLTENVGFSDSIEEALSELGSLAKTGIDEMRLMFEKDEVLGKENCGLINEMPYREVSPFKFEKQFCFLHLTLQELLAAREIAKMDPSELSSFISLNASKPRWHLVIQFVAGLLCTHGKGNEAIISFVHLLCDSLTERSPSPACDLAKQKQKSLLMIKCLHEYGDKTAVKKAALELQKNSEFSNRVDLSNCQVTPADCVAIAYFVKNLALVELNLGENNMGYSGVLHLCDALKDENCTVTKLNLSGNHTADSGVSYLCDVLKQDVDGKLTELNLSGNRITDSGVSHLCDVLKDGKLTKLNLSGNSITSSGVSELCGALKDVNCKLRNLNLGGNNITDEDVSNLCDVLTNATDHCELTALSLEGNNLTDLGVTYLCGALKDVNCRLTELNLGGNNITNSGVSDLCDALKDSNCKLTELDLGLNNITDDGVLELCDTLKDVNCELSQLNISHSYVTDSGVLHLCDALVHKNCQLTKLDLNGIEITDTVAMKLASAIQSINCKLTNLCLGSNNITSLAKMLLDEALEEAQYNLTTRL